MPINLIRTPSQAGQPASPLASTGAIMTRAAADTAAHRRGLTALTSAHGVISPITEPNMLTTIHDRLNAMQESESWPSNRRHSRSG